MTSPEDAKLQGVSRIVGGGRAEMDRDCRLSESTRAQTYVIQQLFAERSRTRGGKPEEAALSKVVKEIYDKRSKRIDYQINEAGVSVQRAIRSPFSALPGPQTPRGPVASSQHKRNRTRLYQFHDTAVLRDSILQAAEGSRTGKPEGSVRTSLSQKTCPVTVKEFSTQKPKTVVSEPPSPLTPKDQTQKQNTTPPAQHNQTAPAQNEKHRTGIKAIEGALNVFCSIEAHWKEVNTMLASSQDRVAAKDPLAKRSGGLTFEDARLGTAQCGQGEIAMRAMVEEEDCGFCGEFGIARKEPQEKKIELGEIKKAHWGEINQIFKAAWERLEDSEWEFVEGGQWRGERNGKGKGGWLW